MLHTAGAQTQDEHLLVQTETHVMYMRWITGQDYVAMVAQV